MMRFQVGVGSWLRPEDALFPSHRDLALFLILFVQCRPRQMFAQYMGRQGGLTRWGADGNINMGDFD